jgi:hypothetical protein
MRKSSRFSGCASLAAVGQWMRQKGIWQAVEQRVVIEQKVLRYQVLDKLLDGLINILAGGHGLVEVNTVSNGEECSQNTGIRNLTIARRTAPVIQCLLTISTSCWRHFLPVPWTLEARSVIRGHL